MSYEVMEFQRPKRKNSAKKKLRNINIRIKEEVE